MLKANRWLLGLLLGVTLLTGFAAQATEAQLTTDDPALEARVQRISSELRCLVCQNQTVADSSSGLAGDLRDQVRQMLKRGASDAEVLSFMTQRYGDFVLYRPPVKATTALLWVGPGLLLLGGLVALVVVLRKRSRLPDAAFDPDEVDPNASAAASTATPSKHNA